MDGEICPQAGHLCFFDCLEWPPISELWALQETHLNARSSSTLILHAFRWKLIQKCCATYPDFYSMHCLIPKILNSLQGLLDIYVRFSPMFWSPLRSLFTSPCNMPSWNRCLWTKPLTTSHFNKKREGISSTLKKSSLCVQWWPDDSGVPLRFWDAFTRSYHQITQINQQTFMHSMKANLQGIPCMLSMVLFRSNGIHLILRPTVLP